MAAGKAHWAGWWGERGQASLLMLGMVAALLAGALVLFGFGQALGARSKHQRAADLAAVSGGQVMSRSYQRLFEPAVFENGLSNPRHLSYLALARAAARRAPAAMASLRAGSRWTSPLGTSPRPISRSRPAARPGCDWASARPAKRSPSLPRGCDEPVTQASPESPISRQRAPGQEMPCELARRRGSSPRCGYVGWESGAALLGAVWLRA